MSEKTTDNTDQIKDGYRINVGMVIVNNKNKLFWGCRELSRQAWQFPQGGVKIGESLREALYRELAEEVGLKRDDVQCLAKSKQWYRYDIPTAYQRADRPPCVGQQQRWFLLRLDSHEDAIDLTSSGDPEFDTWFWVDYWHPIEGVAPFKRDIYKAVLNEFAPILGIAPQTAQKKSEKS